MAFIQNNSKETLSVNEIFYSIQGESSFAGCRCVFIRLAGCDVRCAWCDTAYAYDEGQDLTIAEIILKVSTWNCNLVEVTGGEPLLQGNVIKLMKELIARNYQVLLETSGTESIEQVPSEVIIIMDIKCPSSGVTDKNRWDNIALLKDKDEIKYVIADRADYDWAKGNVKSIRGQGCGCEILFSPVWGRLPGTELAKWILEDKLDVRLQLQLHKLLNMK